MCEKNTKLAFYCKHNNCKYNNFMKMESKILIDNPFVVGKYISDEYFCDRLEETKTLIKHIENGRNVALISQRRIGKSGLIEHTFSRKQIESRYYTFFIDIYGTRSFAEFIYILGKGIFEQLKTRNKKFREQFFRIVRSLKVGFSFDSATALPSFDLSLGDVSSPDVTLDEIFEYIDSADKPCVIAFDEFQQIANYPDGERVEALLRTKIQHCKNAQFIFAGSKRHLMAKMFMSATKPFYQSVLTMGLTPIPYQSYLKFAQEKFRVCDKLVSDDVVEKVYNMFDGTSWYVQMMMNELFALTPRGEKCDVDKIEYAFANVVGSQDMAFRELMDRIPAKQKQLLLAIAKDGDAKSITSGAFIKKHRLLSASSIQVAAKALLNEDIITQENGAYRVYDYFFAEWIRGNF